MTCGAAVTDGSGFEQVCDRRDGHDGPHESHWVDRDKRRRVGLTWSDDEPWVQRQKVAPSS